MINNRVQKLEMVNSSLLHSEAEPCGIYMVTNMLIDSVERIKRTVRGRTEEIACVRFQKYPNLVFYAHPNLSEDLFIQTNPITKKQGRVDFIYHAFTLADSTKERHIDSIARHLKEKQR